MVCRVKVDYNMHCDYFFQISKHFICCLLLFLNSVCSYESVFTLLILNFYFCLCKALFDVFGLIDLFEFRVNLFICDCADL